MKKIAFISTNDWVAWGGSEVLWSKTALQMFNRQQIEVAVCVKKWPENPPMITTMINAGIRVYFRDNWQKSIFYQFSRWMMPNRIYAFLFKHKNEKYFFRILKEFKPDLMVLSQGDHNEGGGWMDRCNQLRIPYVVIIQLVTQDRCIPDGPTYYRFRNNLLNSRRLFFVSYDNLKILQRLYTHNFDNAEIISNPFFEPNIPIEFPSLIHNFNVGVVASLNFPHKGQDLLFEVIHQKKWRERNIIFNLIGTGPYEKVLLEMCNFFNLENVRFLGHINDITLVWASNHILLMPSRMEGMSLSLLEAIIHKRTAIVTDIGDASKLINDNVNGFIIKAPTIELLDEAMERAWNFRAEWNEFGERLYEKNKDRFMRDPIKDFELKVIELVMAENKKN